MDDDSFEKKDNRFNYQMLSRLKQDCNYFLGNGNRSERSLWAGSVDGQIAEMKSLWEQFSEDEKPEWLTYEEILDYEKKMKQDELKEEDK